MTKTRNERVSILLKNLQISPAELAKMMQKDSSTMYRIVNNESEPTKTTLRNMAIATGANFDWLLTGKGEMMDPNPKNPAPALMHSESTIETALLELKNMFQSQLSEKDKQIAGLLQVLGKVNFLNAAQKPDQSAILLNLNKSRSVQFDAAA
jgi:transcriptional regulator with XRE-family HTH domain